ncbi:MAG TPA: hypothetical protein VHU41_08680, partial [Thermoanaerobaculia bacterium]|nr:hypothetical protein [Thermoanaerobaculia bacterium]
MKRAVAVVLFVLSAPAVFGGVRYHFEYGPVGQNQYSGVVAIDGTRARIDFTIAGRKPRYCFVVRDSGKHFRSYTESEYGKTYYEATPDDV